MSSLPLQPAAELATKADLACLRAEMHELHAEIHELRAEVIRQYRTFLGFTIGSLVALTGIFSIIVGLVT